MEAKPRVILSKPVRLVHLHKLVGDPVHAQVNVVPALPLSCSPWWIGRRPVRNDLRLGEQCQWL